VIYNLAYVTLACFRLQNTGYNLKAGSGDGLVKEYTAAVSAIYRLALPTAAPPRLWAVD
jgi:hypothetical protein